MSEDYRDHMLSLPVSSRPWFLPLFGALWLSAGLQEDGPTLFLAVLAAPIFVGAARQDWHTTDRNPFIRL